MIKNKQLFNFDPFQITILKYTHIELNYWKGHDLCAPFWRVYWVSETGLSVIYNDERIFLEPGKIMLIPPHTHFTPYQERPIKKHYIHFTIGFPYNRSIPGIFNWNVNPALERLIGKLLKARKSDEEGYTESFILLNIITDLLHRLPKNNWSKKIDDRRILRVFELIEQNIHSPLSNKKLAGSIAMSTNAFIRFFTQAMRQSPQKYQMERRIDEASILLLNTDLSIEEIAERCGFSDRYRFSKMFPKHRNGIPPATFRKQHSIVS